MTYTKLTLIIVFALLPGIYANAQQDHKWSLEECINYAIEHNLDIQRADLARQSEKANLKQSRFERLPTLNLNASQNVRWGRSIDPTTNTFTTETFSSNGFSGSSNVTLFNGFQQMNTIKQNQKNYEQSEFDYDKSKNDVMLNIVGFYLDVIFAKEQLENANLQLETTSAQLERTQKMVEAGALPITDELELQAQQANDDVQVINAENNVTLTLLNLQQYLQIPASETFDVQIPVFNADDYQLSDKNVQEIYQLAENQMPEIKRAEAGIASAEIGEKLARGGSYPILGLGGDINTNYSNTRDVEGRRVPNGETQVVSPVIGHLEGDPSQQVVSLPQKVDGFDIVDGYPLTNQWKDNISYSFGLNLRIPIFNGLRVQTNKQLAEIQLKQAEINDRETRNRLRQNIETAYTDAKAALKTFEAAQKQIEAQEAAFQAMEKRYNAGASNYTELQVASNNLYSARSNFTRAKFDYIFKIKVLDFYLSKPLTL